MQTFQQSAILDIERKLFTNFYDDLLMETDSLNIQIKIIFYLKISTPCTFTTHYCIKNAKPCDHYQFEDTDGHCFTPKDQWKADDRKTINCVISVIYRT